MNRPLFTDKAREDRPFSVGTLRWLKRLPDNDHRLPPNDAIDHLTTGYVVDTGVSSCAGEAPTDTTSLNIEHGVLFQVNGSVAIYHFPADNSTGQAPTGVKLAQVHTTVTP